MPANAPNRRRLRIPAISIAALVVLALVVVYFAMILTRSAKPSDTIILPESAIPKTSCPAAQAAVPVTELGLHRYTSCNMEGDVVIFPDGVTIKVGPVGGSTEPEDEADGPTTATPNHVLRNLGSYGVVAVRATGDKKEYWGASHGTDLVKKTPSGF